MPRKDALLPARHALFSFFRRQYARGKRRLCRGPAFVKPAISTELPKAARLAWTVPRLGWKGASRSWRRRCATGKMVSAPSGLALK